MLRAPKRNKTELNSFESVEVQKGEFLEILFIESGSNVKKTTKDIF